MLSIPFFRCNQNIAGMSINILYTTLMYRLFFLLLITCTYNQRAQPHAEPFNNITPNRLVSFILNVVDSESVCCLM